METSNSLLDMPVYQKQRSTFVDVLANYQYGSSPKARDRRTQVRLRYRDLLNCKPNCNRKDGGPPYFSVIILVLCIVTFCHYNLTDFPMQELGDSLWIYKGTPQMWEQPYRFLTYSVLHMNLRHLLINMIVFVLTCALLELHQDSFRPAIVYTAGICLGSLLSGIVAPGIYLLGASGGCFAIVLMHLADMIINGDIMDKSTICLRALFVVPLVIYVGFDTYHACLLWSGTDFDGKGVSYAAHVAGAFTGLFFGAPLVRNLEEQKWEKIVRIVSIVIYVLAFIAVIVLNFLGITIN